MERRVEEQYRARVRGCLLGGAVGDALGGPIEFRDAANIVAEHPDGVRTFVAGGNDWPPGTVTDDTQMTLFAVEGLIRAGVRTDRGLGLTVAVTQHAFDRWLDTQLLPGPSGQRDGWLQGEQWLYARRAPGNTCLTALTEARKGDRQIRQFGAQAVNNSKGCGGVMRAAPFGLLPHENHTQWVFDAAAESAGYTHGHPTGKLASGALAALIYEICQGAGLDAALDTTQDLLSRYPAHEETSTALAAARELAKAGKPGPATVEQLGGGWIAEEALAIGVYAALARPEPEQFLDALALAVTHSGDSDSTGAICGNLLGALHGETALPAELVFAVEGRGVILQLADDFVLEFVHGRRLHGDHGPETAWRTRYPGW
ncbi:ADP-ribosylation/Crystallin J1 [Kribbella flavida DSM 17836]|uniref:ADP-ribosylation/Crystallin J1 n=1 Tax=Kribbella flavida (strain DSM 17836 / JCM 10339 / NBRC 14399) TaxID=479435 RepID=D2PVB8_KRIFD|nr:ADP-ribosylglycohydrolase family protein [Kribbella flavida]ADB33399.1 ADP-ribosylation/Crystallin J1 [Kribbella flavida DSM 17836]